jgi:regulator of cell morphogenesis and NO signaling
MSSALLDQPVGYLARTIPGSTRLFHEYKIDFCCGGKHSLRDAVNELGVDGEKVAAELQKLSDRPTESGQCWDDAEPAHLINYLLEHFHAAHREQVPELIRLARRVEQVHAEHPACPHGLADHLTALQQELESHMLKEEQILFPMLMRGAGPLVGGPISVMQMEHDQHGVSLRKIDELTGEITTPRGACNTWRALYAGLRQLRDDLMEHIHLENNILFENALAQKPAGGCGCSSH